MASVFQSTYSAGPRLGPLHPNSDLRQAFSEFILGVSGHEAVGRLMVHRRMDKTTKAIGYDPLRGGSTQDPWDDGQPFQWTESFVIGYFTQTFGRGASDPAAVDNLKDMGRFEMDKAIVYLMSGTKPQEGDYLYRVETSEDGSAYYPIRRMDEWRVVHAEERREEHRKMAFYICVCEREEV